LYPLRPLSYGFWVTPTVPIDSVGAQGAKKVKNHCIKVTDKKLTDSYNDILEYPSTQSKNFG
jgi:hypothetical protein